MFNFFLESNRKGILTFCGSDINIEFDINNVNGKRCFRNFDNGQYKLKPIITKHPNIVKSVIIGKKSWGLWLNQWVDGIIEFSFTKEEILEEFNKLGIVIPESLLLDFDNRIEKKRIERNLEYLKELRK